MRFFIRLGFLSGDELGFRENMPFLRHFGFPGLESLVPILQIVSFPHTAHPGRGDQDSSLGSLLGRPQLVPCGRLHGNGDLRVFNFRCHPILEIRFASTHLL